MSQKSIEECPLSPRSPDEPESARKRRIVESSVNKSWCLTDSRTDQEVLQEMGVSLLDPEDMDSHIDLGLSGSLLKSGSKRKRNIENVNPNVNSAGSSAHKPSPRTSPRKTAAGCVSVSPIEFYGKALSSEAADSLFIIDEETPEAQLKAARGAGGAADLLRTPATNKRQPSAPATPQGLEDEILLRQQSKSSIEGVDSFAALGDEMMLSIFRWLPKRSLAHCMLVCKRWHRVASDETFWQRLDLGNRTLAKGALARILARKPVIIRLAGSEIGAWHPCTPASPSRIQYLDLSMSCVDRGTLGCLLERCTALRKLSLEGIAVDEDAARLIGKCTRMETLNLTMTTGLTPQGLTDMLQGCQSLQSLNISWCNLCAASLKLLGTLLPQKLQRLNIAGARIMSDAILCDVVSRCPRLLELDVSDCSRLGLAAINSISSLGSLQHLALSRCYILPAAALNKLGSMPALQYLEVWGMMQDSQLATLKTALPAIQINQFMHSAIARPTVGTRRTSVWGLRTRD